MASNVKEKTTEQLIAEVEKLRGHVNELQKTLSRKERTEEVLRESEQSFRLVFEGAKDPIIWAESNSGLIIRCNRAAEELFERKRDELVGRHMTILHPAHKAEYYIGVFRKHLREMGAVDDESEIITKSGKIIPVHVTASVTMVGEDVIMQGVFRDVSLHNKTDL